MADEPRRLSEDERRYDWLVWNDDDLKPTEKLFLLALFRWHIRYPEIFLGEERLAKLLGCCVRTVRQVAKDLERERWFTRQLLGKGTTGRSYSYRLRFPRFVSKADDEILKQWRAKKLVARLEWRMDNAPDNWWEWSDSEQVLDELASLNVNLAALGVAEETISALAEVGYSSGREAA